MAPRSNASRLVTLLYLVRLGAVRSFANLSTEKLGNSLEISQQAASIRLLDLESVGMIERAHSGRGLAVRLTEKGQDIVETFLAETRDSLERGAGRLSFTGTLFAGMNEGGYYVSLKGYAANFSRSLGFAPFPGTLNLRLASEDMIEQRRRLDLMKGIEIPGFSDKKRSYGPVKCFRAKIQGKHPGAVLAIERTHYDSSVLEVISPSNLRKSLGLRDGDECSVIAYLGDGWARRR